MHVLEIKVALYIISETKRFLCDCLLACCKTWVVLGVWLQNFYTIMIYKTLLLLSQWMFIQCMYHGVHLLLSFSLQIAYRKVKNLQIGAKLVGKVSINLLCYSKSVICIISMHLLLLMSIVSSQAVKVVHLNK